jgi:hypothetical protein
MTTLRHIIRALSYDLTGGPRGDAPRHVGFALQHSVAHEEHSRGEGFFGLNWQVLETSLAPYLLPLYSYHLSSGYARRAARVAVKKGNHDFT